MNRIKILPPHIQNMIAAGEVVERPANVVKELVENSLDAEADKIDVEIQGGGQILVVVQDNGIGMSKQDLELAVKNHATSKISSTSHLFSISSYGFRGEAIPSIGSVSHLKICSKSEIEEYAYSIEVFYGEIRDLKIDALNKGTRVEVRDLFLKVPARLKFLKSTGVEAKRCEEVFYKIGLVHLDKEFSFIRDGRVRFMFHKHEDLKTRLSNIWPKGLVDSLIEIDFSMGDLKLHGYLGDPKKSQARGDRIIFYVNKRVIKDKLLLRAIKQAYSGMILGREYPYGVLFLEIPTNEVDVNVHPAKMEVRFRDESRIFSLIHRGVSKALTKSYSVSTGYDSSTNSEPYIERGETKNFIDYDVNLHEYVIGEKERKISYDERLDFSKTIIKEPEVTADYLLEEVDNLNTYLDKGIKYLGQIEDTYLLIKQNNMLIIIDQHAAHERVLYEKYKQRKKFESQPLLIPIKFEINPTGLQNVFMELMEMGFKINLFKGYIEVEAIPSILDAGEARSILDDFLNRGIDNLDEILKLISCKKAIKAGTSLSLQEAMELIRLWIRCKNKEFCPHGRPVAIKLGERELEKMFKRR